MKNSVAGNITKSAIISYISIFINILISFFYTPWMIHKIGVSDYGLFHLVLAFVSYFIMDFGLNSSVTRFMSKYRAEGNIPKIKQLLGIIFKVFIAIDFVILAVLFVCYFFIQNIFAGLTFDEIEKVKCLFAIAGLFSVLTFALKPVDGALNAFELFIPNKVIDLIQRVGIVLLVILILLCNGNVYHLILINCSTALLCSLTKLFVFYKKTKIQIDWGYNNKSYLNEIFSFSGWIFMQSLAMRFRLSFIPTVLGIMSNSTQIAIFSLGISLESMIWTMSSALNGLFLPKVSRMSYEGNRDQLLKLMIKVGRIQLFIVFFIFSGFAALGGPFVVMWAGVEFSNVNYIVLLLTISYLVSNTTQIASDLIMAENKVKYTTTVTFITSALGLCGSFLLAGRYGALGCAACSGLALVMNQFLYFPIYQKKLRLDVKTFFIECHINIMPKLFVVAFIFYVISQLIYLYSWLSLIAACALYALIYWGISYCFLFNKTEKQLVTNYIKFRKV